MKISDTSNSISAVKATLENRYLVLLTVLFILYLLPTLCGYPFWPGAATTAKAIRYDNIWDILTFSADHRPIREFIAKELWSGRLPLWMPHNILGLPILEQYEYQLLNPLEWLTYLGHDIWWTVLLCAYLFVGALGVEAIAEDLGASRLAAIGGAVSYVAAGHIPLFYSVPSWYAVTPILPWILYCISQLIACPRSAKHFVGLWLSVVLLLLSGQPQIILCTCYFTAFFFIAFLTIDTKNDYARARSAIAVCLAACALAILTAMPQIMPFAEFVVSKDAFTGHPFDLSGWRITAVNLLNLVFPWSMGVTPYENWTHDVAIRLKPSEDFPITYYAVGSLLASMGVCHAFRAHTAQRKRMIYAGTVIFTLCTISFYGMLNWPVWPFEFVHLARYTCPVLAALLSVMIALGLTSIEKHTRTDAILSFAIIGIGTLTLGYIILSNYRSEIVRSFSILEQVSILSITSLLSACAVTWMVIRPTSRTAVAALIIFIADATLQIRYGFTLAGDRYRYIPFLIALITAISFNYRNTRLLAPIIGSIGVIVAGWVYFYIKEARPWPAAEIPRAGLQKGDRIATSLLALSADSNMNYDLNVLGSRNPITFNSLQKFLFQPGLDIAKDAPPITTTIRDWRGFSDLTTGPEQELIRWTSYCAYRTRFNAISVNKIVAYRGGTIDEIAKYQGCESGLAPIDLGSARFSGYVDEQTTPRAYLASSCRPIGPNDVSLVVRDIHNISTAPFVENNGELLACESGQRSSAKPLTVRDLSPTIVEIDVPNDASGLVVLNDQYFKGWVTYADGLKITTYRVNSIMRGAIIRGGTKTIRFEYEPNFMPYLAASLSSLFLVLILTLSMRKRAM
ncbi:hypothetical protein A4A58_18185 [Tardiphaga robiniae]|uniref:YfhO family protein n=1 Tax=Tardiphaga robiniae TaxID=943830 RepID=A0A161SKU5_9BRAD|nr:hypothetical protein A4A58_18185 [Tardiphaga robiniae]